MASFRQALLRFHQNLALITQKSPYSLLRSHAGSVSRVYSNDASIDVDLSSEEARRRLHNRSRQRGFLELDLVLGNWVEEHIRSMDELRIRALVDVLDLENPDLWKWLTGQEQLPEAVSSNPVFTAIQSKVLGNLNSHCATETLSNPGRIVISSWNPCRSLLQLNLSNNLLQDKIRLAIGKCVKLKTLLLNGNILEGRIPPEIGRIATLRALDVSRNSLTGGIPKELGSCKRLSLLVLTKIGRLHFQIQQGVQRIQGMGTSRVSLVGSLRRQPSLQCWRNLSPLVEGEEEDEIGDHLVNSYSAMLLQSNALKDGNGNGNVVIKSLELADNRLIGSIPPEIGDLPMLKLLNLRENYLNGSIPDQLGSIASLVALDLSRNSLTGSIPQSFSKLTMLETFNVSFNNLSGSIPHLQCITDCDFFIGNPLLQPCVDSKNASSSSSSLPSSHTNTDGPKWNGRSSRLKSFEVVAVASASFLVSTLLVLLVYLFCSKRKLARVTSLRRKVVVTFTDAPSELNYENVVRATGNFSIQKLIGTGGFGATYKAELVPGYHMGESDMFLIYNYLPGGNLETFIHEMPSRSIKYPVVHKIALDVAQALAYLHYSCVPRIGHRDIKPSNILLDEKLNADLSDFGLARLLEVSETHATTDVAKTFGYVAPEYATTCRVSDKADVYSFGVVLLELMSGKRSLDPSFSDYGNGFTIVAWGRLLIQEGRSGEAFHCGRQDLRNTWFQC
ncbi:hypothetical protein J5N97_021486 [Dioscorea zingiberensis]|uniref:Protein kinase domain-containing protein n=1 Tax=Dioscorea zingiberensis TaxID=325984 RepID=A0A9D5CJ85_9LILI|nr:hypothetical protein J5N97_021486 [Dioscorea zingiberensis]